MKYFYLLLIALTANITATYAQKVEGIIKDAKTNEPLPYVNIGIVGKGMGTVSDAQGKYKLALANHASDTLRISMVGYATQLYTVANFLQNSESHKTIALKPVTFELKEVKVGNHKWKEVVLGNTTKSQGTNAGFSNSKLGYEIGSIIKIKKSPTYLKRFNAWLSVNTVKSVKLRLNFYTLKDGLPYQIIQNQNIYVTVKAGDQSISVDLEPYNIMVEDKFFASLEWIETVPGQLMFSASLFGGSITARETSQAAWEKVGIAGLGFNVLAEY